MKKMRRVRSNVRVVGVLTWNSIGPDGGDGGFTLVVEYEDAGRTARKRVHVPMSVYFDFQDLLFAEDEAGGFMPERPAKP